MPNNVIQLEHRIAGLERALESIRKTANKASFDSTPDELLSLLQRISSDVDDAIGNKS